MKLNHPENQDSSIYKFKNGETYNIIFTKQDLEFYRSVLLQYLHHSPKLLKKILKKSHDLDDVVLPIEMLKADIKRSVDFIRTIETVLKIEQEPL